MWLISFSFVPAHLTERGFQTPATVERSMVVTHEPPAQFVLNSRRAYLELQKATYNPSRGPLRADNVTAILSAFEIEGEAAEELASIL